MESMMNKLITIQSQLKAPKNQKNTFGNYNYRSCEDILEAVKPLLLKHECNLILSDKMVEVGERVYVRAQAVFTDGENVTEVFAYARESVDKKGMDSAQITGAASSYARKYALNGLFLIDDTKDADTQDNRPPANQQPQQQAQPTPEYDGPSYEKGGGSWAEENDQQQQSSGSLIQEASDSWVQNDWNGKLYGRGESKTVYIDDVRTDISAESITKLMSHPKYKES
jgi:hypothetical protein